MRPITSISNFVVRHIAWSDEADIANAESFIGGAMNACLMQEPVWGRNVPGKKGHEYRLFGVFKNSNLYATALVRLIKLAPGRYLASIRRGPVVETVEALPEVILALCRELKTLGAVSVTFNPRFQDAHSTQAINLCQEIGATILPLKDQPIHCATGLISLGKSEDALSAQLKQRGRRQIKAAVKAGLEIRQAASLKEAEELTPLMNDFYRGRKLSMENVPDIAAQWSMTREKGGILLGYFNGQLLCGHCFLPDFNRAFWLTMVSNDSERKLPKNYLLLWHAILLANQQGFDFYDVAGMPSERFANDDSGAQNRNQFKTAFDPQVTELFPMMKLTLRPIEDRLVTMIKARRS